MKPNSGITLVEIIIVIAIIGVLVGLTSTNYFGARSSTALKNQVETIVADLRFTMSRASAQENDSQWGIRFHNESAVGADYYEVWYGSDYDSGSVASRMNIHGSVDFYDPSVGNTKDIIFQKATGLPTTSSTIAISSLGGSITGTINVNTQGRVDYLIE